ncbi:MAG: hypothetical protein JNJ40_17050 [Bacteroidia bacterium]|nr:hypothetical protein [Bacteroidia bacterium]
MKLITKIFFCTLLLSNAMLFSQDNEEEAEEPTFRKKSKFQTGFYVGSLFANKYSASTYNGYGFDREGNRNTFINSYMHQKIVNEYGGGYGQYDYIADAIGVDQRQWTFNESDMPFNMRYVPAIIVGFNFKAPINGSSAFIFNVNAAKLGVEGNFTITKTGPTNPNPAANNNILNFPIKGSEQRLLFEMGFQKLLGEEEGKLNFFIEAGFVGTLAKYDRNMIYINNLQIDLTYYVNQAIYPAPVPGRKPVGFGVGAFAGLGANVNINPKFTLQLLYTPSYEKINIGTNPTLKLQNAIGLRVYYNLVAVKEKAETSKID